MVQPLTEWYSAFRKGLQGPACVKAWHVDLAVGGSTLQALRQCTKQLSRTEILQECGCLLNELPELGENIADEMVWQQNALMQSMWNGVWSIIQSRFGSMLHTMYGYPHCLAALLSEKTADVDM
eukprot:6464330-Amphidinium_carterae.1